MRLPVQSLPIENRILKRLIAFASILSISYVAISIPVLADEPRSQTENAAKPKASEPLKAGDFCIGTVYHSNSWELTSMSGFNAGPKALYEWTGEESEKSNAHVAITPYGCVEGGSYRQFKPPVNQVGIETCNTAGSKDAAKICLGKWGDSVFPDLAPVLNLKWYQNGVARRTVSAAMGREDLSDHNTTWRWRDEYLMTTRFWHPDDPEREGNIRYRYTDKAKESVYAYTFPVELVTTNKDAKVSWFSTIAGRAELGRLPLKRIASIIAIEGEKAIAEFQSSRLPNIPKNAQKPYLDAISKLQGTLDRIKTDDPERLHEDVFWNDAYITSPKLGKLRDRLMSINVGNQVKQRPPCCMLNLLLWVDDNAVTILRRGIRLFKDEFFSTTPLGVGREGFHTETPLGTIETRDGKYVIYDDSGIKSPERAIKGSALSPRDKDPDWLEFVIDRIVDGSKPVRLERLGALRGKYDEKNQRGLGK